jgi:hypothetical protein
MDIPLKRLCQGQSRSLIPFELNLFLRHFGQFGFGLTKVFFHQCQTTLGFVSISQGLIFLGRHMQEIGSHASLKERRFRLVAGLDLGGFYGAQEILKIQEDEIMMCGWMDE